MVICVTIEGAMLTVNLRHAEVQLSEPIDKIENGEEVVITKHGHPVARMFPYRPTLLTPERLAAIDHAIAVMDEPLTTDAEFRAFTRDEMHENS